MDTYKEFKMDKLEKLFSMQKSLNAQIMIKKDLRDRNGNVLTPDLLINQAKEAAVELTDKALGPNTEVNQWLKNFLWALNDESRELKEELLDKWWSKDYLNLNNIRVEIIDQLHFWLSLAMTAGMDADDVMRIYEQKNSVNLQRQESGYSKATKTEDDNKSIK
jgi:dimeric dUTPase (all-alpha-NTP-PPase superfamily)